MIDAHGWAAVINSQIQPPAASPSLAPAPPHQPEREDENADEADSYADDGRPDAAADDSPDETDRLTDLTADLAAMMPTKPAAHQRWRAWWVEIGERPDATNKQLAEDLATSVRTVQRIRAVGAAGLLDSPQPPTARLLRLAATNGIPHPEFTP
jgi:hypothetical protein